MALAFLILVVLVLNPLGWMHLFIFWVRMFGSSTKQDGNRLQPIIGSAERTNCLRPALHPGPGHPRSQKRSVNDPCRPVTPWTQAVQTPPLWQALQSAAHPNRRTQRQFLSRRPSPSWITGHTAPPFAPEPLQLYVQRVVSKGNAGVKANKADSDPESDADIYIIYCGQNFTGIRGTQFRDEDSVRPVLPSPPEACCFCVKLLNTILQRMCNPTPELRATHGHRDIFQGVKTDEQSKTSFLPLMSPVTVHCCCN